ncbi:MAG: hypothetical protein VX203_08870 [Pseudomonadota bacterium]|nr:hypothetical protein [Pseudomonadota bacterium]
MEKQDTAKDWLKAIAIWMLLGSWTYFFVTGLYAGGCYKGKNTPEERLRTCTNAERLNGFLYTRHQEVGQSFALGLALADLGRMEEAFEKFKFSLTHTNAIADINDKTSLQRFLNDNRRDIELSKKALITFFAAFASIQGQAALEAILDSP